MKRTAWEREFLDIWRQEQWFLRRYDGKSRSRLEQKASELAPEALEKSLRAAFVKAFEAVFEKGDGLIRSLGRPERRREICRANSAAAREEDRKSLHVFYRQAAQTGRTNVALAGAAGVGMGALGIALPDVPLLTALLLKNVYETAESVGFRCDSEEERLYALCVMEAALSDGAELRARSRMLDVYAQSGSWPDGRTLNGQIVRTARALSETVLYGKVLQNVPLAGAVGGMGDAVCMSRVRRYAAIKYYKRFLICRRLAE